MCELPNYLVPILNGIAKKEGFINYTTVARSGSNAGDNYSGVLISVEVKGNRLDNNKIEIVDTLNLLCKLAPSNPNRRKDFLSSLSFGHESYFYNEVSTSFLKFQNEKGLPKEDQFSSFPKCYAAIADDEKEQYVIVMQDLRPEGFDMWPKDKPVPIENIRLVIKELAKFHAVSFVMKDQRPEDFSKYKAIEDILIRFLESSDMKKIFDAAYDRSIKALRDPDHKNIYLDLKKNTIKYFEACLIKNVPEKFGVFSHGDCWNNNILYRVNKNNNTVEDICLVDWQVTRCSSPSIDLLYNIFTSTDKKLRDEEYVNLLNLYYDTLCSNIEKMGSDPQKLFTYEDFQSDLKRCGNYALLMAPIVIQLSVVDSKDVVNLDDMYDNSINGEVGQDVIQGLSDSAQIEFDNRINDMVNDLVHLGYYTKQSDTNDN